MQIQDHNSTTVWKTSCTFIWASIKWGSEEVWWFWLRQLHPGVTGELLVDSSSPCRLSFSLSLSLSLWDFLTVNPENRQRTDTAKTADIIDVPLFPLRTKSITHCISLSSCVCLCSHVSHCCIFTPSHINSGRSPDLVQSCEGSAGF